MFTLIIVLMTLIFAFDIFLSLLNYSTRNNPIPSNVTDVYDESSYEKWLLYSMETHRLSLIVKVVNFILLLGLLVMGFFPFLSSRLESFSHDPILQTLLFLGVCFLLNFFFNMGFSWYSTFNIEERYGFNQSSYKTFFLDQLKALLLVIVLGGGILYFLLSLYMRAGNLFVIFAWLFLVFLMGVLNILYTKVFIRFFNKLSPLPEGELKESIYALTEKTGYGVKQISVMDASKRSSRLNAFFSGFGKFKHIVLYDTLIEKCSVDQVTSVLAHEIGHAKHKDVARGYLISIFQMAVFLVILTFFLSSDLIAQTFGFTEIHMGFALIIFSLLMEPIGILMGIPLSALSRKAEYRADAYAAQCTKPQAMIGALKILARENFANLTPHPFVVKMSYSHPPISQRIEHILKSSKQGGDHGQSIY